MEQTSAELMSTVFDSRPEKRLRRGVNYGRDYREEVPTSFNSCGMSGQASGMHAVEGTFGLVDPPSPRICSRAVTPPWREDDKDGHFVFQLGENITSRYKIISKLGEGTFGRVLECWDRECQKYVAVKVIRNVRKYRDAAMIEIDVLRVLAKHDKNGAWYRMVVVLSYSHCVQLKDWFDFRNHVCIVCERLGPSLYDFLRKNNYRSFSIDLVREFARQLLESVAYMHELSLIHTDLKPENILLVSSEYMKVPDNKGQQYSKPGKHFKRVPKSTDIKLIDFGSATFESHYHCSVISTRHYRAPEVIMGLGWSYPCDLWSIGCILVELCSGDALFQTHENLEHLAMMERVLGAVPPQMVKRADRCAEKYFRHGHELNWPEGSVSRESVRAVRRLPRLRNLIMQHVDHSAGSLIDLLQELFKFDPGERISAKDALRHPFFREQLRRYNAGGKKTWCAVMLNVVCFSSCQTWP